jgi:hypothetical protein
VGTNRGRETLGDMLIYANVTKYLDPDGLGNLPAFAEN